MNRQQVGPLIGNNGSLFNPFDDPPFKDLMITPVYTYSMAKRHRRSNVLVDDAQLWIGYE